jgi:hypothetical protein
MLPARVPQNRRQHARFPLGLPVKLHVDGRDPPITVEVVDVSEGGARLRAFACPVRADQHATLRFLLPEQRTCVASGRVAWVERALDPVSATFSGPISTRGGSTPPSAGSGTVDFVLRLEETNDAFRGFLASLAG